jgi:hypothetical protein
MRHINSEHSPNSEGPGDVARASVISLRQSVVSASVPALPAPRATRERAITVTDRTRVHDLAAAPVDLEYKHAAVGTACFHDGGILVDDIGIMELVPARPDRSWWRETHASRCGGR